jgi:hypothetical protein
VARGFPAPPRAGNEEGRTLQIGQDENVELTGFEPVTPLVAKHVVKTLRPGGLGGDSVLVPRLWSERCETRRDTEAADA